VIARLLRRHEPRRPDHDAGLGQLRPALAQRDPEVEHLHLLDPPARQEQVARL